MALKGKTVLINGAAGGIGSAICRRVIQGGNRLVAVDLVAAAVAPGFLGPHFEDVLGIGGDTADFDTAARIVHDAEQQCGPIDVLVNVAGRFVVQSFVETSAEEWRSAYEANLLTAVAMARAVSPGMMSRRSGVIINFASTAGETGSARPAAPYAAAKGAVIAFTKSLAREHAEFGIRVNAVSPGPIETRMFADESDRSSLSDGAARTLVGRMGLPDEVAAAVLFLADDDAAYVTGEVLRINGGSLI